MAGEFRRVLSGARMAGEFRGEPRRPLGPGRDLPPGRVVELLRQRSRPYLFSNTIAPAVVGGSLKAIELLTASILISISRASHEIA